ncbi:MAG: aminodeoxychorismate synthase component I [Crocinitomicaceae bacterium]|nr:aminodeoxychorismate synthase component I [Crocinitomicaceae bacterium]|tara:strand:- start:11623 stop:12915 length:1293 start_codon:yes stop_codon:yes gene_type:complete
MRKYATFPISASFKSHLIGWLSKQTTVCFLDSHPTSDYSYPGGVEYDFIVGIGAQASLFFEEGEDPFEALSAFHQQHNDWLFGHFNYDLKNSIEQLSSANIDELSVPELYFFVPEIVLFAKNNQLSIGTITSFPEEVFQTITNTDLLPSSPFEKTEVHPQISHADYIRSVLGLKHHIQIGDIYEVNFCQEFHATVALHSPLQLWNRLVDKSPTPFSAYYQFNEHYLMCASPERFLKKKGQHLISQPIKGTIKRGKSPQEDEQLKAELLNSEKEKSENVMIVDLVRNDLSRSAQKGTVRVDELFGIYTFPQVHQMISTVSSKLRPEIDFSTAIKNAFPMGSMTGAPKVKAMELIEHFEATKRGLYSGAVGYITPDADFDFNVVIRSLQYNSSKKKLSFIVGGAITALSDPEAEYDESILKAKAILEVLGNA